MAEFLQNIINNKAFEKQLEAFCTIDWQLSLFHERLEVSKNNLTEEQRALLDALVEKKYLGGPGSFRSDYTISPPEYAGPEQNALWNAALPAATERMKASFAPIVALPWDYTEYNGNDFVLRTSALNAEQKALLEESENLPVRPQERPDLKDTLYTLTSGRNTYGINRLHDLVKAKLDATLSQDAALIARLPWRAKSSNDLVLQAETLANLPATSSPTAAEAEEIFTRYRVIQQDGLYMLLAPPNLRISYSNPEYEAHEGRQAFFTAAYEALLKRQESFVAQRWRFDTERHAFVTDDDPNNFDFMGTGRQATHRIRRLTGYRYENLPNAQFHQLRETLRAAIPDDFAIEDLAELPWKTETDLCVPVAFFLESRFAAKHKCYQCNKDLVAGQLNDRETIYFRLNFADMITISQDQDHLNELPWYVAITRAIEKRTERFVTGFSDEIRSLPWRFYFKDRLSTNWETVGLHPQDLSQLQKDLVATLSNMKQMEEQGNIQIGMSADSHILHLLRPLFEEWKQETLTKLIKLPWQRYTMHADFFIPAGELSEEQSKELAQMNFLKDDLGRFSTYKTRERMKDLQYTTVLIDQLRCAIAEKIRAHTPVTEIPEEVLALPWHYHGGYHGRDIIVSCAEITDEQADMLKSALPEIRHSSPYSYKGGNNNKQGCFEVDSPDSANKVHAILEKPYFDTLKPIAERHLSRVLDKIATFPWRKNKQGTWEVSQRELTESQYPELKKIPWDYFDRESAVAARQDDPENPVFILSPDAPDKKLLSTVNAKQNTLPGRCG